jgi:hypothetical protein
MQLQRRIVTYLDEVQSEAEEMATTLEQNALLLDQMEQSILERAFRGVL